MLTSKARLEVTLKKFIEAYKNGKLASYLSFDAERYQALAQILEDYDSIDLAEALNRLKIVYKIEDARNLSLESDSIDLVNSNNTFEHIYPEILFPILREFKRVVKKQGGVMSHSIDMSDHFAHFDKSISIYNFLRFTDEQWKWIDNSIQPQSRLRIYDYQKMYADLGIPITHSSQTEGDISEVKKIPLAEKYAGKPVEEVAVSHCHFVSDMGSSS